MKRVSPNQITAPRAKCLTVATIFALSVLITGCGTMMAHMPPIGGSGPTAADEMGAYSGVRLSLYNAFVYCPVEAAHGDMGLLLLMPMMLADAPFSLVADTFMLPSDMRRIKTKK